MNSFVVVTTNSQLIRQLINRTFQAETESEMSADELLPSIRELRPAQVENELSEIPTNQLQIDPTVIE